jgi:hypothetical protein
MGWNDYTGCKGDGSTAVGYWGTDVYRRVLAEEEQARQRALLTDEVRAGGIRSELWKPVTSGDRCNCYKESNQQADRKCYTCHGIGYVLGYRKFGYNTVWLSGSDSTATFTNIVSTIGFKSGSVQLDDDSVTGTIYSDSFTFSRTAIGSFWEYDLQTTVQEPDYSSITVEYSLNAGKTWVDISNLPTANPSSGTIRFRVTIERDSTDVLSPLFEILRARYATISLANEVGSGVYRTGPWILAMRDIPFRQVKKQDWGDIPFNSNEHFWTVGLSEFDTSITHGSDDEALTGSCFISFMDGIVRNTRHVITSWQNSDPFAYILVSQTFTLRIADTVGPYSLVW